MKTNLMHSLLQDVSKTTSKNDIKDTAKNIDKSTPIGQSIGNKSLQSILKDLLSDLVNNTKSSKSILNSLKNETIFKEFKHFGGELKLLIKLLNNAKINAEQLNSIKKIVVDIKSIDDKVLKTNISKSGIFLESHIKNLSNDFKNIDKNNIKQDILNDMKTILLKISDENPENKELLKQTNKLLTQVDYYQLLSSSGCSNHTYLPFYWDELENGDINFKEDEKDNFSCHISLQLKHYGGININMIFAKPNQLSMAFFVQQDNLKEKIQSNLKNIRKSLKSIDVDLKLLNIFDLIENENLSKEMQSYTKYNNSFGIDIRV